jgi:hypothetical protein
MNLRMLRWTIKHGVCRFSPTVFSTYGVVLCGLGELELAHMFGELLEPRYSLPHLLPMFLTKP